MTKLSGKDKLGRTVEIFDDYTRSTLANCLMVAADKFKENADAFRQMIDMTPSGEFDLMPHGAGARRLAEQFDEQEKEARRLRFMIEMADDFSVPYTEEDDEEDAA